MDFDLEITPQKIRECTPAVTEALTKVFGKQYAGQIRHKLDNFVTACYQDPLGLKQHADAVYNMKLQEMSYELAEKIGLDTSSFHTNWVDYAGQWHGKPSDLISSIFGNFGSSTWYDYAAINRPDDEKGIKNEWFKQLGDEYHAKALEYRENFNDIHDDAAAEQDRRDFIHAGLHQRFFQDVFPLLPSGLRKLFNMGPEKNKEILLGQMHAGVFSTDLERFDGDAMDKIQKFLDSGEQDPSSVSSVIWLQRNFLQKLEILEENRIKSPKTREEVLEHMELLQKYSDIIPSKEEFEKIDKLGESYREDYQRKVISMRPDFITMCEEIGVTPENNRELYKNIYENVSRNKTCMMNTQPALMMFTLSSGLVPIGNLMFTILHELIHIATNTFNRSAGLDIFHAKNNDINTEKREFEILNEILTDTFALEARAYLMSKGVYLLEPKERTKSDSKISGYGQSCRKLLAPLVRDYREEVIDAVLNGSPFSLASFIGRDNFEELNQLVNELFKDHTQEKEIFEKANQVYQKIAEATQEQSSYQTAAIYNPEPEDELPF
ncbi:MAG: hypothetical protein FWE31_01275 [Firmicutes bacterium]|nr:hypothetical protein [Bacillota bacterium]